MRKPLFALYSVCTLLTLSLTLSSFISNRIEEYGIAAYYSDSLQGRKTASGEKYDKADFTCAHKTYPFGTKVRITRLDNKKSVVVRVNDRGPFQEGHVVDISRAAAEVIGLVTSGTARVKVELEEAVLAPANATAPAQYSTTSKSAAATKAAPANKNAAKLLLSKGQTTTAQRPATYSTSTDPKPVSAGNAAKTSDLYMVDLKKTEKYGFGVQIITLSDANNVFPQVTKLEKYWSGKVMMHVEQDDVNNVSSYKVVLGPYTDRKTAEAQQKLASKRGYPKSFVVDLGTL